MYFMKTRFLILMIVLLGMFVGGCHEIPEGFLETGEANYNPDTLIVRKTLDPKFDEIRMENGAPWVSIKMEGYLGTEQINFSIESVTSEGNEAGAAEFMKNCQRSRSWLPRTVLPQAMMHSGVHLSSRRWQESRDASQIAFP